MSANQVIILNLLLLFLFLLIFLKRKHKTPSRLKLRAGIRSRVPSQRGKSHSDLRRVDPEPSGIEEESQCSEHSMRSLNVHFEHKGKMWDAYQTLELPAGASLKDVEQRYLKILQNSQVDRELMMKALDAIKKSTL